MDILTLQVDVTTGNNVSSVRIVIRTQHSYTLAHIVYCLYTVYIVCVLCLQSVCYVYCLPYRRSVYYCCDLYTSLLSVYCDAVFIPYL